MPTINNISYAKRNESDAKFVKIPEEGQTPLPESKERIEQRSYNLSERNGANAYIIPTEVEKLYLNFIPQKVSVGDQAINEILQPQFEYFVDEEVPEVEGFTLPDGMIFRCVSADSLPKPKEDYTYYIMMNGAVKTIPNYKTLEVMLAERGQTLLSVRVIEQEQCDDLPKDSSPIVDKSSAWKEDYADITTVEAFRELENNAKEATEIAEGAKEEANKQIEAVKEQAAADKAEAEASKKEAEALKKQLEEAESESEDDA